MSTGRSDRQLAVILHADVMGSTVLVQRDETLAHERIRDAFTRLSEQVRAYGGVPHEVRGDALVATFERASDAACAALAFQVENARRNDALDDDIAPSVRIGISLGEVVIADATLTGPNVVLAQRIEQLAQPGGICIQGGAVDTIPHRFPFDYSNLGEREIKGFDKPVQVHAVALRPGAGVPAPEPTSRQRGAGGRRWPVAVVLAALLVVAGVAVWIRSGAPPAEVERAVQPTQPESDRPSIAVLPFVNISNDPEQEPLANGFTEDLITVLSKLPNMIVTSRTSTSTYKGKDVKVADIASELGVRYVLEGSIQKSGERIRITAQLIEGATETHLWAEKYDRALNDIFAIQDEITRKVAVELAVVVKDGEWARYAAESTDNFEVYELTQRAHALRRKFKKAQNLEAEVLLNEALALDPDYVRAIVQLGWVYENRRLFGWSDDSKRDLEIAEELAHRALALGTNAYASNGLLMRVLQEKGDHEAAIAAGERAIAAEPGIATGHALIARTLIYA